MPRKRDIQNKKIKPDPIFNNIAISKLTNMIMSDGKKSVAEKIVYEALEILSKKNNGEGLVLMEKALQNVSPSVEVKSISQTLSPKDLIESVTALPVFKDISLSADQPPIKTVISLSVKASRLLVVIIIEFFELIYLKSQKYFRLPGLTELLTPLK